MEKLRRRCPCTLITLSPEVILQLEAQAPARHDICCKARGLQRLGESVGRVVCRDRSCYHVTECLELCKFTSFCLPLPYLNPNDPRLHLWLFFPPGPVQLGRACHASIGICTPHTHRQSLTEEHKFKSQISFCALGNCKTSHRDCDSINRAAHYALSLRTSTSKNKYFCNHGHCAVTRGI